ncbi:hypothetical protein PQJ75_05875 [Rhodoplanes sp. TEM]|uniref:Uncharacterized protein n=1 Tax=Rhodoplanes tepidamans TaxID=200616 RepID=A0ABT5J3L5_RHOTP|nr:MULTISPECIES: hypothetical protein [Rhodoplanes]MDC7784158.1 hypothetical protein [Rhodoplanes tepidamans]MDC7983253.1 hypothetical protein [Rhodoplanes sp. TEM]MDQ0356744.1 hypothetical protein [Rhodoplanes tepidamans]
MHDFGFSLLTLVAANPLPTAAVVGSSLLTVLAFVFPSFGVD